jgi:hypothetical protein
MLEQWEALRSRLSRLGTPQRWNSLILAVVWPLVVLIIAVLAIRLVSTAKELADLISAFAALMWPVAVLTLVGWFRPEIRAVLSRIRKGKLLGQEFELDELQAKTEAAEATVSTVVSATGLAEGTSSVIGAGVRLEATGILRAEAAQDEIEEVLREASRSPRIGLMLLSAKMERAARDLATAIGLDVSRRPVTLNTMVRQLVQAEQLTYEDAEALNLFNQVRNRIVHGHDAGDDEVARAIDSGTRLLRLLLSRPRPPQSDTQPTDGG